MGLEAKTYRICNEDSTKKPMPGPKMKSRGQQEYILLLVEDEEDELLQHRAEVDVRDTPMAEVQVDPLREQFTMVFPRNSRSTTVGPEVYPAPLMRRAPKGKAQPIAVPTVEGLKRPRESKKN
jgi:hypothetical protein